VSEIRVGDAVWQRVTVQHIDAQHGFITCHIGTDCYEEPVLWTSVPREFLPDHPALPAVARWLAEHGRSLIVDPAYPDRWIDWLEEDAQSLGMDDDDLAFRVRLEHEALPALRALLAAYALGMILGELSW
jgi:hypothetical protein